MQAPDFDMFVSLIGGFPQSPGPGGSRVPGPPGLLPARLAAGPCRGGGSRPNEKSGACQSLSVCLSVCHVTHRGALRATVPVSGGADLPTEMSENGVF